MTISENEKMPYVEHVAIHRFQIIMFCIILKITMTSLANALLSFA